MKICLIGSSHVAMLIAAQRPGIDLTVFAKPGLTWGEAQIDGSFIQTEDAPFAARLAKLGTPARLDLSQFDAVGIVALMPSAFAAARIAQGQSISGRPSGEKRQAQVLAGPGKTLGRPLMTRDAYRTTLQVLTRQSLLATWAATLRSTCDVPIFAVPQPHPSEDMLRIEGKYPIFRRIAQNGDGVELSKDLRHAHRTGLDQIDGLTLLEQPAHTIAQGCFTDPSYVRGATRLSDNGKQEKDDVLHGNAKLGNAFWDVLTASI